MNVFIPCNPGDLSINTRDRGCIKKGRIVHNETWTRAFSKAVLAVREAADEFDIVSPVDHPCMVHIDTFLPRTSRKHGGVPLGDVDSPVKAVLDILTKANVWIDDMLCTEVRVRKHHVEDDGPGIEVSVTQWR